MKKLTAGIFTVLLAAVSMNAYASVTSKAYVDDSISTERLRAQGVESTLSTAIGTVGNLTTSEKTNLVGAINEVKGSIPTVPTNVSAFNNDAGYITSASIPVQVQANWTATEGNGVILNKPTLAAVATSGSYNDLTNKPTIDSALSDSSTNAVQNKVVKAALDAKQDTIPANTYDAYGAAVAVVAGIDAKLGGDFYYHDKSDHQTVQDALDAKQDKINDLSTIRSGAAAGATALQPGSAINGANITAGTVAKTALASGVQTSLGKADSAVQSVSLTGGTNNGTVKLTVDGQSTDNIAVTGLGSAAYANTSAFDASGAAAAAQTAAQNYANSLASNYAPSTMKLPSGTFTPTTDGVYVLTAKVVDSVVTYSWEDIGR